MIRNFSKGEIVSIIKEFHICKIFIINFIFILDIKEISNKKKWTVKEIEKEIERLDNIIKEAEELKGDIDVRDAMLDKATFLKNIAKYEEDAEKLFREAYAKSGGASKKMEILFEILQMTIHNLNIVKIKKDVETCKALLEEGADWEKKKQT